MRVILANAFSINMIDRSRVIHFDKITLIGARKIAKHIDVNAIGHADTDRVVRRELNCEIKAGGRATIQLEGMDKLLVAQYRGPRLEEGATSLPDGATIEWWLVTLGASAPERR